MPFRIIGEQIGGSLKTEDELYPLKAKWQQLSTAACDLRDLDGKIQ